MDFFHHILMPGWHLLTHNAQLDWEELNHPTGADKRWPADKAHQWYRSQPYLIGCNYIPAYAGNQLEMWGMDTFDPIAIEKELNLAVETGLNCVRVYLHDLLYEFERDSFYANFETFLDLCEQNSIRVIPVFFDDCWNRKPEYPNIHQPLRGMHNSMWLQSPGARDVITTDRWELLEQYITCTINRYAKDKRIILWDVYNEPGNAGLGKHSASLLVKAFEWARSAKPEQPLTSGIHAIKSVVEITLGNSDVITFHHYAPLRKLKKLVTQLEKSGRPVICTEYMGRHAASVFQTHLPYFRAKNIGAIHWGLVSGRSQAIYPWQTIFWPARQPPEKWFHDLYHPDHRPYDAAEIQLIRSISRESDGIHST